MAVHHLSRQLARRLAVRAQLLDSHRPQDLMRLVEHLTLLQIDPTAVIAPNADLVAWSRLGTSYEPDHLRAGLEDDRTLFEFNALIRPMSDLGLYLAGMARWPTRERARRWLDANGQFRHDVLARLEKSGPLLSRDIPDSSQAQWGSTGWTNNRNVTQMLEFLMMRGEVAVAGRRGRQRIWDLAERVYPSDVTAIAEPDALRMRNERRLRALGIARARTTQVPVEPWDVGDVGEPAAVAGTKGEWRIDPEMLSRTRDEPFVGRTALLSPFDRLVHDRSRILELFDYEYVLEMYKPKQERRWGYFALPILHGDRLIGKLDAKANRNTGLLEVYAIHEDVPFSKAMTTAVRREIVDLAAWLGLDPDGI
jgi:uncharacterized protein YcaQ